MQPLPPDEAHLYYTRTEAVSDPAHVAACLALLSPDERARHDRFLVEQGRREHLVARALVRTVLSRYAAVAPGAWRFQAEEHGRPYVVDPPLPIRFNLSHSRGLVACLVLLGRDAGVDVEHRERKTRPLDIAHRFFAPPEVERLRALPEAEQPERFFTYWTLKESYIKARGLGLRIPLGDFWFEVDVGPEPTIAFTPALDDRPERWRFLRPTLLPTHASAVCLPTDGGPTPRLHLREVVPLGT